MITKKEYRIYGNYGQGFEEVTAEETHEEARARLKEYNENEPQYPHILRVARIKA